MNRIKTFLLLAVIFCAPLGVFAQAPVAEVNGSYQFTRVNASGRSGDSANGIGAGGQLAVNATKHLGVVADFAGIALSSSFGTSAPANVKVATFVFGPRVSFYPGTYHLYFQALGGGASAFADISRFADVTNAHPTDTSSAALIGGGLEKNLSSWCALRVIEADYLRTALFGRTQNNVRAGAGITFRFGRR